MGLASSLTTALTGLQAAETQIDVVGNNLANAQTVGFKASRTEFATQLLSTQGLGSAPSETSGGTNPRQTGLGVKVAEISPNFTQGTVEISTNPSDLAIQGDGFFVVRGNSGEQLYTRNGQFNTNASSELVNASGYRVLGYGIDEDFQIQETQLVPLTIPLGQAAVAQATSEVVLEGNLTPTGDVAEVAEVIESDVLGDATYPQADGSAVTSGIAPIPNESGVVVGHSEGAGSHAEGSVFQYKFVYVDSGNTETLPSSEISVTIPAGNTAADNAINLNSLPAATGDYTQVRIYRTANGGSDFFLLDTVAAGSNYVDDNSVALSGTALDETALTGSYTYKVTYYTAGQEETRPSAEIGPLSVSNGRIQIGNLPTPPSPGPGDGFPNYTEVRIYRTLSTDASEYYLVGTGSPGESFTDNRSDAEISDLSNPNNQLLNQDGPSIGTNTRLVDVLTRSGSNYTNAFEEGELTFAHRKGGRGLGESTLTITDTTTVSELMQFIEQSTGIFGSGDDSLNPIPGSENRIPGETGTLLPGVTIVDGQIRVVSNNGVDNAVSIGSGAFSLRTTLGETKTPHLGFGAIQEAEGQSAITDFVAYDSLGIPINVRVTTVLESRDGNFTTYRWFAESPEHDPLLGSDIGVGTGLITFDGEGAFVNATNTLVAVDRENLPSSTPLEFELDFSSLSGLASDRATLSTSRQDGSPAGTLTSYRIGEDGIVTGVFTNGSTRDLGRILLANFANPEGLEQRGNNAYAQGANSGLSFSEPGANGTGSIVAGAVELSNTDIGRNLIDLVLASTLYRGNSRVITTSQQLFDELLNLRR